MELLIDNTDDKELCKEEKDIFQMLIDWGMNPMSAINCTDEIIEYVNKVYSEKP